MSQLPVKTTYDFQSVGRMAEEFQNNLVDKSAGVPVGIKTPMEMSTGGSSGPFKMHTNLGEQIKDNFRNMLSTNHGERLMLHDFGANLEPLAFELTTEAGDVQAVNRIRRATEKYMPFIQLDTFEPIRETNPNETASIAVVGIRVIYSVPKLGLSNQGVEVVIYAAG